MKIGILTHHFACNFGANLQLLSTVMYLRNAGHSPLVINWYSEQLHEMYTRIIPTQWREKYEEFQKQYFPLSEICKSKEDIAQVIQNEHLDLIIVGSDAVVQHHPLITRIKFPTRSFIAIQKMSDDRLFPNCFWGDFFDELVTAPVMAMLSVSSQNSPYKYIIGETKSAMKNAIDHFSYISVRDTWTQKMFKHITSGKICPPVTPDPVFGFNYNVSNDIQLSKKSIQDKFKLPEKYILLSFRKGCAVSQEWLSAFEKIANRKGYECIALPMPNGIDFKNSLKNQVSDPITPLEWYALIKYASGYVGNNMHPIVVSLHNSVPCFSFDNYGLVNFHYFVNKNSSKIYHILNFFGLTQNRISVLGKYRKRPPTPISVWNKLQNFPKTSCMKFSYKYLEIYEQTMSDIISTALK